MSFEEFKEKFVENMGGDLDAITEETDLQEDLGLDSLDAVELAMNLEEEFDIEIEDEDFANFKTLGDIYNYLVEKIES